MKKADAGTTTASATGKSVSSKVQPPVPLSKSGPAQTRIGNQIVLRRFIAVTEPPSRFAEIGPP